VTVVPELNEALHVLVEQLMPAGNDVTPPWPEPAITTLNVCGGRELNVAVVLAEAFSVIWHAPVPEQAPLQPENDEPMAGVAVSVMAVPTGKLAAHWPTRQLMPAGDDVTVPFPVPARETLNVGCDAELNVAVVLVEALSVNWQVVPFPEQAPVQPEKVELVAGASVSVT
jgi:hypothetical protein